MAIQEDSFIVLAQQPSMISNLGIQTSGDYIYKEEGINNYSGQNGNTNPAAVGDLGGYTKYKINMIYG